jgi:hypothetical protein
MKYIAERRLDRASRKAINAAVEAGLSIKEMPSPEALLAAAELADKNGDPFGLGGIGKIDLLAHLVKG